jgi:2-polyprenyl-3-methyl-5-hydroxy-6-metoxy-1,4-benzoquinol methylase
MTSSLFCRICGAGKETQNLRAEAVFGGKAEHNFWQCEECNLIYIYPIPTPDEEHKFYAQEFEKFMETRSGSDRDWSGPEKHIQSNQDNVKRRLTFIDEHLKSGMSILEVGCSSGFMMDDFKEKGYDVEGVEPSGCFSEFLVKKGHISYSSLEELKEKNNGKKYDLIIHFFVLEHIRDTQQFLEDQLALLNEGGMIICEVPNGNDPLTSLYTIPAFEKFYWSIAHHYYFTPKSISHVLDNMVCQYNIKLEQRYDISNHLHWLQVGKPGGQGKYDHIFSETTKSNYRNDLLASDHCDTFFLYLWK